MDKDCPSWSKNQVGRDNEVILWQQISNQYCSQSNTVWSNQIDSGWICTPYVSTKGQIADVLTVNQRIG